MNELCAERATLGQAVVEAGHRVYAAMRERSDAENRKLNTDPFDAALVSARLAEREAVRALDGHRKTHHC
jgi:hypothetical protein